MSTVKVGPSRLRHPAVLLRNSRLISFVTILPTQSKSSATDRVLFPHCDVPRSSTLPIFGFAGVGCTRIGRLYGPIPRRSASFCRLCSKGATSWSLANFEGCKLLFSAYRAPIRLTKVSKRKQHSSSDSKLTLPPFSAPTLVHTRDSAPHPHRQGPSPGHPDRSGRQAAEG